MLPKLGSTAKFAACRSTAMFKLMTVWQQSKLLPNMWVQCCVRLWAVQAGRDCRLAGKATVRPWKTQLSELLVVCSAWHFEGLKGNCVHPGSKVSNSAALHFWLRFYSYNGSVHNGWSDALPIEWCLVNKVSYRKQIARQRLFVTKGFGHG